MAQLRELQKRYEQIGDVRGIGLMLAIDFVKDPVKRDYNYELNKVIEESFQAWFGMSGCRTKCYKICSASDAYRAACRCCHRDFGRCHKSRAELASVLLSRRR